MTRLLLNIPATVFLLANTAVAAMADEKPAATKSPATTPEQITFVRTKVLPLLEARCFECHKQAQKPKGGLRLSSRRSILVGGDSGPAIVPGKPDESLLVEAIRYEGFEMPPRTKMPQPEIDILVRWIADGAPWPAELNSEPDIAAAGAFPLDARRQSHWAWQPIRSPAPPKVRATGWVKDTLDAFVLAKLEAAGLRPAADADRRTLIRRVYFDLIGLPPSVEQVESFVADQAGDDDALADVVEELLAAPQFGERWARHWLDLVRYAETLGHEFDYPLHHAWRYRDYVIRAFNGDVPYDQFVREHIAGDLLSQPRQHPTERYNESIIGTGFWFLCEDKHAPVDVRAEEAGKIDNQIDVFSKTFLGMTVACARCHDHKFDAISTKDYYALAGFLQSSRRQTASLDPGRKIARRVDELRAVRAQATALAETPTGKVAPEELRRYALAALDVIHGEPTEAETAQPTETVFEDFESPSFDGWEVSGKAFLDGPSAGPYSAQQKVSGFAGDRLANSWRGNDRHQGILRSSEFQIEQPWITFLIGGGAHKDKTCMNLVVDGMTVRTATGRNSDRLFPESWDVSEFKGKTARLEILDQQTGAWGHIDVDHIVFTDTAPDSGMRRQPAVVAAERDCDPALLQGWVSALRQKTSAAVDQPLSLPAALAQSEHAQRSRATDRWRQRITQSENKTDTTLYCDLRAGIPDGWFTQGQAFSSPQSVSSVQNRQLEWRTDGLHRNPGEGVSSATLSRELQGTLATPTFELQHPEILIRAAGQGTRVRLVIDGYLMFEFNGLLFKGTQQKIDTDGEFRWLRLAADVHRYQGHRMHLEFLDEGHGWFTVQEIRFADQPGAAPPAEQPTDVNRQIAERMAQANNLTDAATAIDIWAQTVAADSRMASAMLLNHNLSDPETRAAWADVTGRWQSLATGIPTPVAAVAMTDGTGENERVFIRGSHRNPGAVAERTILTALAGDGRPAITSGSGRRELADQVLSDDNPLPARVAVNRIWHHLFGRGIVESTDNFGVLGTEPTHPELLNHLASRFRTGGWSVKQMIRAMVLSRTYRMASERSGPADQKDPTNQLLHRANIRRLQGEAVRDAILTVSGRLDRTLFGAPVPVHLTTFMQGRGRPGTNGPVDGNGRRSIYISVNRNFLSPFMQAFDVPAPVTTIGKRTISNVPAQALILLNNDFVNQQSKIWAEKLLAAGETSTPELLSRAWYELFGRPPSEMELQPLIAFAEASAGDRERVSVETLTEICHVLINSKEFLFLR